MDTDKGAFMAIENINVTVCSKCDKVYSEDYRNKECNDCGSIILEQIGIRIDTINECRKCGIEIPQSLKLCNLCQIEHVNHKRKRAAHVQTL
ncbi:hypothetical protein [Acetoanaerobium pronyense]|nr:hypothetical protein [Acetoanaerobium pronyense]